MSYEQLKNGIPTYIPRPFHGLIASVAEVAQDTFNSQRHLNSMTMRSSVEQLREQKIIAHVLGMVTCNALKHDEPVEDEVLAFKNALSELPPEVNISTLGFDDEQLGLLGKRFGVSPNDEIK